MSLLLLLTTLITRAGDNSDRDLAAVQIHQWLMEDRPDQAWSLCQTLDASDWGSADLLGGCLEAGVEAGLAPWALAAAGQDWVVDPPPEEVVTLREAVIRGQLQEALLAAKAVRRSFPQRVDYRSVLWDLPAEQHYAARKEMTKAASQAKKLAEAEDSLSLWSALALLRRAEPEAARALASQLPGSPSGRMPLSILQRKEASRQLEFEGKLDPMLPSDRAWVLQDVASRQTDPSTLLCGEANAGPEAALACARALQGEPLRAAAQLAVRSASRAHRTDLALMRQDPAPIGQALLERARGAAETFQPDLAALDLVLAQAAGADVSVLRDRLGMQLEAGILAAKERRQNGSLPAAVADAQAAADAGLGETTLQAVQDGLLLLAGKGGANNATLEVANLLDLQARGYLLLADQESALDSLVLARLVAPWDDLEREKLIFALASQLGQPWVACASLWRARQLGEPLEAKSCGSDLLDTLAAATPITAPPEKVAVDGAVSPRGATRRRPGGGQGSGEEAPAPAQLAVGSPFPAFQATSRHGPVDERALQGRVTLVLLVDPAKPEQMVWMQTVGSVSQGLRQSGLSIQALTLVPREKPLGAFLALANGVSTVAADPETVARLASRTPVLYLVDVSGRLAESYSYLPDEEVLRTRLRSLYAGK